MTAVEGLARDTRSAIVSADDAAKVVPSHGPLSRSLDAVNAYSEGLALARQGNHEEAVKRFKTATEIDSSFALAFARMALSYSSAGNDAEAQQASTRAVELSESAQPADKFFILANDASIKGDSDKAIEYYKQLVDAAPSDVATRSSWQRFSSARATTSRRGSSWRASSSRTRSSPMRCSPQDAWRSGAGPSRSRCSR